MPLYLSPRAGAERRKGVDVNNMRVLSPIDWSVAIKTRMQEISDLVRAKPESVDVYRLEYTMLNRTYQQVGARPGYGRRASVNRGYCPTALNNDVVIATIMSQCLNREYPTLKTAIRRLRDDPELIGVSLSLDFALVRHAGNKEGEVSIFHRLADAGTLVLDSGAWKFSGLSSTGQRCLNTVFERSVERGE